MTKKNDHIQEAIKLRLEAIAFWQAQIQWLTTLNSTISDVQRGRDRPSISALWDYLHQRELDEWRSLFLFGSCKLDDGIFEEVRKAAYERFLKKGMSVMGYLEPLSISTGRYYVNTGEEFKKQLKDAFRIHEKEDE